VGFVVFVALGKGEDVAVGASVCVSVGCCVGDTEGDTADEGVTTARGFDSSGICVYVGDGIIATCSYGRAISSIIATASPNMITPAIISSVLSFFIFIPLTSRSLFCTEKNLRTLSAVQPLGS
jgi:hypothetical protein